MRETPKLYQIGILTLFSVFINNQVFADVYTSTDCEVNVSHASGFYPAPFDLQIETSDGCEVYYTLDATSPIEHGILMDSNIILEVSSNRPPQISLISEVSHSGAPWMDPVGDIQMATVLRLVAKDPDGNFSDESVNTYFIGPEYAELPGIPVVSLVFDEDSFFDHESGIYVLGKIFEDWQTENPDTEPDGGTPANYLQVGEDWERPSYFEYFDEDGEVALSQHIGVRLHGGWSLQYAQKSFRLYSRSEYGVSRFRYRFFDDTDQDDFNRLILRNSGQDWDRTKLQDIYQASLIRHLETPTQAYKPVLVYLNGEYWGLYNLRERIDQHYLETYYGIDRDEIDIIDITGEVNHGTNDAFYQMLNFFLDTDLSIEENYQEALKLIDLNTFIEHYVTQIYGANTDWPGVNQRMWRKQTDGFKPISVYGHDGRWYWMIFDQDFGFRGNHNFNALEYATQPEIPRFLPHVTVILRKMLENESFRNEFVIRFMHQINTSYAAHIATQKLDELSSLIEPYIEQNYRRWDAYDLWLDRSRTINDWKDLISYMRVFAELRPDVMTRHLIDFFDLDEDMITLTIDAESPEQGTVSLNHLVISDKIPNIGSEVFPYEAPYFKELKYTVKAIAQPGYRFVRWTGDIESDEVEITFIPESDFYLKAEFEPFEITDPGIPTDITPHKLYDGEYRFEFWSPDESELTFPESMYFAQSDMNDPELDDPVNKVYYIPLDEYATGDLPGYPYNNSSRTRINGLGDDGISFINTGRGRDVGAVVLVLDATETEDISIRWTAGTIVPNFRTYNIRLQFRTDPEGEWYDVMNDQDDPVEYHRNVEEGHAENFGPDFLPDSLNGVDLIQLRWKYYYTGVRLDGDSGQRDMLRLDDIIVSAKKITDIEEPGTLPEQFSIHQNYPNPFNNGTVISYDLPTEGPVKIKVYDILGRQVSTLFDGLQVAGTHNVPFNADMLSSGIYIYMVEYEGVRLAGKMTLAK